MDAGPAGILKEFPAMVVDSQAKADCQELLRDISHHYGRGFGGLRNVSLTIRPGEKIGVVGRSGAAGRDGWRQGADSGSFRGRGKGGSQEDSNTPEAPCQPRTRTVRLGGGRVASGRVSR